MALTYTSRYTEPQWGAGSDSPSRALFNAALGNIEKAAYDDGVTQSALPTTSLFAGRYVKVNWGGTDYTVFRHDGTTWDPVGGSLLPGALRIKSSTAAITDRALSVEHPSLTN